MRRAVFVGSVGGIRGRLDQKKTWWFHSGSPVIVNSKAGRGA